jgi:hypothetical protein
MNDFETVGSSLGTSSSDPGALNSTPSGLSRKTTPKRWFQASVVTAFFLTKYVRVFAKKKGVGVAGEAGWVAEEVGAELGEVADEGGLTYPDLVGRSLAGNVWAAAGEVDAVVIRTTTGREAAATRGRRHAVATVGRLYQCRLEWSGDELLAAAVKVRRSI